MIFLVEQFVFVAAVQPVAEVVALNNSGIRYVLEPYRRCHRLCLRERYRTTCAIRSCKEPIDRTVAFRLNLSMTQCHCVVPSDY